MDETMKLVVGWTVVGGFVFTTAATLLSMVGWLKFADPKQQKLLFKTLVAEVIVGAGASALGGIRLDPDVAREESRTEGGNEVLLAAIQDGLAPKAGAPAVADKRELERLASRVRPTKRGVQEAEVAELRATIAKLPDGKVAPETAKILIAKPVLTRKTALAPVR